MDSKRFLVAAHAATVTGLPEFRIRAWIREGKCPGFRAGSRFYIDVPALVEQLDAECRANGSHEV